MLGSRRRGKGGTDESGQAMAEFAIVAPVLLFVVFAIIKLGILFNQYLILTDAVRSGARVLSISRGTADPCGTAQTRVKNSASSLNPQLAIGTDIPTPTFPAGSGQNCGSSGGSGNALIANQDATVTASYRCDLTIMGINYFPSCKLQASETIRVE